MTVQPPSNVMMTTFEGEYARHRTPKAHKMQYGFDTRPDAPLPQITRVANAVVRILAVLLLTLATGSPARAQDSHSSVKIGVLAKSGDEQCLKQWGPTAEYLTSQIPSHSFTIVPLGFDEYEGAVVRKEVDFIMVGSSYYVGLERDYGVNRLVTLKNLRMGKPYTVLGGVIFRRADRNDIVQLSDLKGKTFMAVNEGSLGGWMAAWRTMKEVGIDPHHDFADLRFSGSLDAIVYAVRDGKVDAGTVRTDTLERMAMEDKIRLEDFRVLNKRDQDVLPFQTSTHFYPEWPLAKVKHTSDELAKKVTVALLGMSTDDAAAKAARCAGWTIPLNYQPVHKCLKELRVGPYEGFGEMTLHDFAGLYWSWIVAAAVFLALATITTLWVLRLNHKLSRIRVDLSKELSERKRAEVALRQNEEKYRFLADNTLDCIWQMDSELRFTYVNPAIFAILGFTSEEWVGSLLADHCSPEDVAEVGILIAELMETKDTNSATFELWLDHKNGMKVCCEITGNILLDGNEHLVQLQGTTRNITERKRAENELRENEAKFRAITTAAQDAVVMMDHEGKVAFWNDAAERIFGWTEEEVMGRVLHEFLTPARFHSAHRKAFPAFQKTGKGAAIGETVELPALCKDGTEIPIELSLSAFQLDGAWCSIGLARDIRQRVETERSQARLKAAIEAVSDMIVITDTEGVIQYTNPAFEHITGYSCKEAMGATPSVLKSGEHDEAFYQDLWDTISRGEVWQGRFVNKKKDGTIYHENVTISPVKDEKGEIVNYVAVKRDVTEQRMMESQLQQAQKLESIGQLAAGIAHEINTPIQYVGDNTRFVRDCLEDMMMLVNRYSEQLNPDIQAKSWEDRVEEIKRTIEELDLEFLKEEIPKALEQSLEGVNRVAEIVLAMKDFSHPGGEEKTPTDLNKAIESTITVCRNRWKYIADLETDFEECLPMVPCLMGEFNQVILNIIVNATDAIGGIVSDGGEGKGQIKVSTRQDGEFVEIRISDTGGGIPREIQQKVFDPFFTTKEVGKGTGQGLAISHDVIVNKHGGTLDLKVEPGVGTTLIIRLPLAGQTTERQEAA